MKLLCLGVALATLAACGQTDDRPFADFDNMADPQDAEVSTASETGPSVGQLLRSGTPEACAHSSIKAQFTEALQVDEVGLRDMQPDIVTDADVREAIQHFGAASVGEFSAVDSDPGVGEMLCEATVQFEEDQGGALIRYLLRPSLENKDDYMLKWISGGTPEAYVRSAIMLRAHSKAKDREYQAGQTGESEPVEAM